MNQQPKENSLLSQLIFTAWIIFFISLAFSFRAVSSISTGLLIVTVFLYNKQQTGSFLHKNIRSFFLFTCLLYFLFLLASILFNKPGPEDWRQLQLKTGIVLTPLAVCCSLYVNKTSLRKLLTAYSIILAAACIYCLATAIVQYINTGNESHFFYHQLAGAVKQHAIYFSLLVFFSLLFLLEAVKERQWLVRPVFHISLAVFLTLFLVLLSSRLVIAFFIFYLLSFIITLSTTFSIRKIHVGIVLIAIITACTVLLTTTNPVSRRFDDILHGDIDMFNKETYKPGDYFNGLQFRLLQWKLVPEILNEQNEWWTGVGAANSQPLLGEKYVSKNMYTGETGSGAGYLFYNTHNQLLESLLKNGIPGALFFLLICFALARIAWKRRNRAVSFTVALLLLYCCTEAVLETQYGILIFTFFPLIFSRE